MAISSALLHNPRMDLGSAFILGVVEGLTEFLPVSSTGHLILVSQWLPQVGQAADAFDIVIQLGAILAVAVQYRTLLWSRATGLLKRDEKAVRLWSNLLISFLPAAVVGLLLRKTIKAHLFGPWPVAIALVVGAVVMSVSELLHQKRAPHREGLENVTAKDALLIGLLQCAALWPGTSRSMSTIVAGQIAGLATATAAEYTFLLGLPTLSAAALYELYKSYHELVSQVGVGAMVVGLVTSFVVSWAVIAMFIRYLGKRGMVPFAIYRLIVGAALIATLV